MKTRALPTEENARLKRNYEVELIAKNRSHYYRILPFEELLPGTTGILDVVWKPALVPWAKKMALQQVRAELTARCGPKVRLDEVFIENLIDAASKRPEKIKDDAADLGTLVHSYIDRFIRGERGFIVPAEARPAYESFQDWLRTYKIRLVLPDTKIASRFHGYGGSVDAVGENDDGYGILDWKTSKGIYPTMALQAGGAYAQAFYETFSVKPTWAAIARFDKIQGMEFVFVKDLDRCLKGFLAAKQLKEIVSGELFQAAQA